MKRRSFFQLAAGAGAAGLSVLGVPSGAFAQAVDVNAILFDPETPTGGNPDGDVTIVAFLDYNCPFCKKSAPDLDRLVRTDGKIRLVYKDWPILTKASVYGAQLALAAKYQGQYEVAHNALMAIPGRRVPDAQMRDAVKASGVDMARLDSDLKAHGSQIADLLKRNMAQADSLRLRGTPVFLVGPYLVESALDYEGFKQVVDQARKSQEG